MREKMIARATQHLQAHQQMMQWNGPHEFMLQHSGHEAEQEGFVSDWHYPKGDRIDFDSGGQYFYHCHRENMETEEHGHFHVFIRQKGWPKSWSLAPIPERKLYLDNPMTHIVAIGLNRYAQPIRLFMVNRWVSRETWFEAEKMKRIIKRYDLSSVKNERPKTGDQDPKWQVMDQWVEHLVHLFAPQIQWLYEQRDMQMKKHVAHAMPDENPYLNHSIEELASIDISLEQQIAWLTGQLDSHAA